ncbi:MAG: hypothetical protein EBU90_19835, partial [Proteobacteria bacterium]|nr:hypothetical protein [Pseudomonadota bacterium]
MTDNRQIFVGKRNLLGNAAANTAGIWRFEDITMMRHYGFAGGAGVAGVEYVIEVFANSGSWVCPTGVTSVDYLVVAGGGGGGFNVGGGGGAGGFRTGTSYAVTPGNTYTVTVGAGGNGGTSGKGSSGSSSVFDTITSAGGG